MAESLEAAGAPPEVVQKYAAQKAQVPEIQPCNQYIVELFFRVQTQWVYAGMAGTRVGLNYPAIETRAYHMPGYLTLTPELKDQVWQGLQIIEKEVLTVQSEQNRS